MPPRHRALLSIDVGTSSVRSAVVGAEGRVRALAGRGHAYEMPRPGWFEQAPEGWWQGVVATLRQVLGMPGVDARDLEAVAVCGQMHSPVPVDARGELLASRVQLWNDRRCAGLAAACARRADAAELMRRAGMPPASSWGGFKVAWLRDHAPEVYERTATFLTPKDYINLRLTGVRATDLTEASGSFLLDWRSLDFDPWLAGALGLDLARFPAIHPSAQVIGAVGAGAAAETGLVPGLPVVAGAGDTPAALLGSGVVEPGTGVEITGTSTVIGALAPEPDPDSGIASLYGACGGWMGFGVVDTGGDSVRWARSLLGDEALDFHTIGDVAASAPAGAEGLLFLPYLNGERLGEHANARGQFFGLTRRHVRGHLYRAVFEGLAFAARRHIRRMRAAGMPMDRLVASGGGNRHPAWAAIKAAIYGEPLVVTEHADSGIMGGAALAGLGVGVFARAADAAARLVRLQPPYVPDPALMERYARLGEVYDRLYEASAELSAELDALSDRAEPEGIRPED